MSNAVVWLSVAVPQISTNAGRSIRRSVLVVYQIVDILTCGPVP